MKDLLIINGPNLNMLGKRDKNQYGELTLEEIERMITEYATSCGFSVSFFQSNVEGDIIDKIQSIPGNFDGLIINAGGYTHTSIAIRDALEYIKVPKIEVHLSNITSRETFRHESLITPVCTGAIFGLKEKSYLLAIDYFRLISKE